MCGSNAQRRISERPGGMKFPKKCQRAAIVVGHQATDPQGNAVVYPTGRVVESLFFRGKGNRRKRRAVGIQRLSECQGGG